VHAPCLAVGEGSCPPGEIREKGEIEDKVGERE
jgi:hypothetical protein